MSHDFGGTTLTPGKAKPAQAVQRKPIIEGSLYPWYFKHHPFRWQVLPDGRVVPLLGKLKGEPGVAGVDKDGGNSYARAKAEDKGWKVLPWNVLGEDYVVTYESSRGTVYLPRWAQLRVVGNRTIITPDTEAYFDWCAQLVDDGIIDPPDPTILDGMADAQRQRMETVLARVGAESPRGKAEIERMEVIEEAAAEPDAPTKVKRTPPKKRAARKRAPRKRAPKADS